MDAFKKTRENFRLSLVGFSFLVGLVVFFGAALSINIASAAPECDGSNNSSEACKNKCSTTYVKGDTSPEVTDCGRDNPAGNPIYPALDALGACIKEETQKDVQEEVDKAMCTVVDTNSTTQKGTQSTETQLDSSGEIEGIGSEAMAALSQTASEQGKLYVPSRCLPLLEKVEELKKEGLSKAEGATATKEEGTSCTYKGVANCLLQGDAYECTTKEGDAATPPPSQEQSFMDRLRDLVRNLTGQQQRQQQQTPQPPGGGGSGGGSNSNSNNQCPSGYTQSSENGRIVCTKEATDSTKPQCLIVASKETITAGEPITIQWRTANADDIDIEGIGENVPKNSKKSLTPKETTTYTLIANGKENETKKCEVTVTVTEDTTRSSTGSTPPKLSCTPTTIKKGQTGTVKWACPTAADSSAGDGLKTNGKLAGEISVKPDHNTEYTVGCLDADDKEIGKNACSVTVGESMYDIIVHPTTAKRGDRVRVSWASLFMKSCRVQGPRDFDFTRAQGIVITEPFTFDGENAPNRNIRAAIYNIECESQFGGKVSKDVVVKFEE